MEQISGKVLIEGLHDLADELGKAPSRMEMKWHGEFDVYHYEEEFGSWEAALETAGLERDGRGNNPIPRAELIDEIRVIAEEVHDPPRMEDMDKEGEYSSGTYRNRFGSWKNAVEAAGLDPYQRGGQPTPKEDLIDEIQRLDELCDGRVTGSVIRESSQYSISAFQIQFGGLRNAREKAGLDPGPGATQKIVTDNELVDAIQRVAVRLGKTPTSHEVADETEYSRGIFSNHFGSYGEALEAAGFDPEDTHQPAISEDELLTELQRLAEELGKTPTTQDMAEKGEYSVQPYVGKFGSWTNAQEVAGLEPNFIGSNLSREQLTDELQRLKKELGKVPTREEMNKEGKFSPSPYYREFESWKAAVDAAGLDASQIVPYQLTNDQLMAEIKRVAAKIEGVPSIPDMERYGEYSESVYYKRFESWKNALEEAGVTE